MGTGEANIDRQKHSIASPGTYSSQTEDGAFHPFAVVVVVVVILSL